MCRFTGRLVKPASFTERPPVHSGHQLTHPYNFHTGLPLQNGTFIGARLTFSLYITVNNLTEFTGGALIRNGSINTNSEYSRTGHRRHYQCAGPPRGRQQGQIAPTASSSKGPHNTECFKVWGPHKVNQHCVSKVDF